MGIVEYRTPRTHARLTLPMIHSLVEDMGLTPKDLSAIAVSQGPGSYTGLRVGVSSAKGLAMALDIPLLAYGSLMALAVQVKNLASQLNAWICPMIDARRMEVYTTLYNTNLEEQVPIEAKIVEEGAWADELAQRKIIFVGNAVQKCMPILSSQPHALCLPEVLASARGVGPYLQVRFEAQAFEELVQFEPFYLKDYVATKPKKRF